MIGALADWFAVVALFRRPLGLPIPHTAILPRTKARLADNLAVFIRDKFLDTELLAARLRAANLRVDEARRAKTAEQRRTAAKAAGQSLFAGIPSRVHGVDLDAIEVESATPDRRPRDRRP